MQWPQILRQFDSFNVRVLNQPPDTRVHVALTGSPSPAYTFLYSHKRGRCGVLLTAQGDRRHVLDIVQFNRQGGNKLYRRNLF